MKKAITLICIIASAVSMKAQVAESVEAEWPRQIVSNKNIISKKALGKSQIRIATYSILPETTPPPIMLKRWDIRINQITHIINDCNIDIVGTQRAFSRQISQLAKQCGYHTVSNQDSIPNAIIYNPQRLEIKAWGHINLTQKKLYDITPHSCTWAKFKETESKKTFYVFNTYLRTAKEAETLLLQIKKIAKNKPAIITADLFAQQYKPAPAAIRAKMKDAYDIALHITGKDGTFHNYKTLNPIRRMDYIFLTPNFIVNEYDTVDEELTTLRPGSDHLPVVADLTLR